MRKKKILFNGLGNRGWIGGLYYLKNIIFSILQNPAITDRFDIVVLIDGAHADIFESFKGKIDIRVYDGENKIKLALYEMKLIWFEGVAYCYALGTQQDWQTLCKPWYLLDTGFPAPHAAGVLFAGRVGAQKTDRHGDGDAQQPDGVKQQRFQARFGKILSGT